MSPSLTAEQAEGICRDDAAPVHVGHCPEGTLVLFRAK